MARASVDVDAARDLARTRGRGVTLLQADFATVRDTPDPSRGALNSLGALGFAFRGSDAETSPIGFVLTGDAGYADFRRAFAFDSAALGAGLSLSFPTVTLTGTAGVRYTRAGLDPSLHVARLRGLLGGVVTIPLPGGADATTGTGSSAKDDGNWGIGPLVGELWYRSTGPLSGAEARHVDQASLRYVGAFSQTFLASASVGLSLFDVGVDFMRTFYSPQRYETPMMTFAVTHAPVNAGSVFLRVNPTDRLALGLALRSRLGSADANALDFLTGERAPEDLRRALELTLTVRLP